MKIFNNAIMIFFILSLKVFAGELKVFSVDLKKFSTSSISTFLTKRASFTRKTGRPNKFISPSGIRKSHSFKRESHDFHPLLILRRILDVYGNLIREENELNVNGNKLQINLSPLPKGVYVLQLISSEKVMNHTVILQ